VIASWFRNQPNERSTLVSPHKGGGIQSTYFRSDECHGWRRAIAIMHTDFRTKWEQMVDVLARFRLYRNCHHHQSRLEVTYLEVDRFTTISPAYRKPKGSQTTSASDLSSGAVMGSSSRP
jgi:hypothetical protein